ncbi:hypothetical protein J1614_010736 [Plenodomus biglobosus]|nr:hypothetical protein J1614_010736 [Plenodomus biglobosus]
MVQGTWVMMNSNRYKKTKAIIQTASAEFASVAWTCNKARAVTAARKKRVREVRGKEREEKLERRE